MAKSEKAEQLALRPLHEQILLAALARIANVLRPYPKGVKPDELEAALMNLDKRGLVHLRGPCPNLTSAGIEAAKALAAKA